MTDAQLAVLIMKYKNTLEKEIDCIKDQLPDDCATKVKNIFGMFEKHYIVVDGLYEISRGMENDIILLTGFKNGKQ
jgi:hypothetical protein